MPVHRVSNVDPPTSARDLMYTPASFPPLDLLDVAFRHQHVIIGQEGSGSPAPDIKSISVSSVQAKDDHRQKSIRRGRDHNHAPALRIRPEVHRMPKRRLHRTRRCRRQSLQEGQRRPVVSLKDLGVK